MSKDRRLGRGLEALLGKMAAAQPEASDAVEADSYAVDELTPNPGDAVEEPSIVAFPGSVEDRETAKRPSGRRSDLSKLEEEKDRVLASYSDGRVAREIPINLVDPNPYQPRMSFDYAELLELKESLQLHGMLQPVAVRQKDGRYQLIAGERRFRAAQECGWQTVPALVVVADDRSMAELALTENMQRRDLNPIEKATAFRNYIETYGGKHEDLAKRLSLDRSTVSNLIRLLDLNPEVQEMIVREELTQGHARAFLSLEEEDQLELAQRIVAEGLSVRETEAIVREYLQGGALGGEVKISAGQKPGAVEPSPHIKVLEDQFRAWLGMKIKLTSNAKGKGKLVIQFNSNDDFERIYQALKPREEF